MLNFTPSGNFVTVKTTYFDKIENKLKFTDRPTFLNLRNVETLTRGQDVIIDGVSYKYYNIFTNSQSFAGISSDLDKYFTES